MAYQLSDIITKVQQRVRDTGYSTAEITNYINDAQNDVFNEYRFRFMRTSQNYTVTIGVADITNGVGLPATLDMVIDLVDTTSGQEKVINFIDADELETMYGDIADTVSHPNGQPLYWYWEGDNIKLFPAPALAYTLKLRYWKKPTILSADDDVPELPSNFEEALIEGATYRVLQVKDNYDQAAIHQNQFEEHVLKAVVRFSTPQSGRATTMKINRYRTPNKSTTHWRS
jgi:hypothetical protein